MSEEVMKGSQYKNEFAFMAWKRRDLTFASVSASCGDSMLLEGARFIISFPLHLRRLFGL